MGKKTTTKADGEKTEAKKAPVSSVSKKRVEVGILHIQSTYNNTKLLLTDEKGNGLAWASSGNLGFKLKNHFRPLTHHRIFW